MSYEESDNIQDKLINKRWRPHAKLGEGLFGTVRKALDIKTLMSVAVKMEPVDAKDPQLHHEGEIYSALLSSSHPDAGIPRIRFFGTQEGYQVLVMDCLGYPLEAIRRKQRKISTKSFLMLGIQALQRLDYIHEKYIIDRNVKPDNMLIGKKDSDRLYIVDFGLANFYRYPRTEKHIPYRDGKGRIGTSYFASINVMLGREQSRRDDLESPGYSLVNLNKGSLPWKELRSFSESTAERRKRICQVKREIPAGDLCEGMPSQMVGYFRYVRKLRFAENPNYGLLKGLFGIALEAMGAEDDSIFDWTDK